MRATTSLYGMFTANPDLFSDFVLPEDVDADVLISNLLLETMELEIVVTNPQWLQMEIAYWSAKQLPIWEHLYSTTQYEYNPIENYNKYEKIKTVRDHDNTYDTENGGDDTTDEYTAAFDSSSSDADTPRSKVTTTYGGTQGLTVTEDETDTTETWTHGNIGVMSSQQMVLAEREVAEFNIYTYIIEEFKSRFCLLVY